MDRDQLLSMWNDMAQNGNWVPSWTDSLAALTPDEALWRPAEGCHSIWQELAHVVFWRQVNLRWMHGGPAATAEEVEQRDFMLPSVTDESAWKATVAEFDRTQSEIAAAIQDPENDVSRVPYHLIHDAYHLGRITQLRAMQGVKPKF